MKKTIGVIALLMAFLSQESQAKAVHLDLHESQQEMLLAREAFLKAAFGDDEGSLRLERDRVALSTSEAQESSAFEVKLVRNSGN